MNCISGNELMLRQIGDLLSLLDDDTYARSLGLFSGSSIGQHVRHIINFYQAVLSGADAGVIDYANRERDLRIEQNPVFAAHLAKEILAGIRLLEEGRLVSVRADFLPEPGGPRPLVKSSVGRELMFAFDHAVHHLAIVKMGLRQVRPDLEIPEELGVAPSTIKFHKSRHTAS